MLVQKLRLKFGWSQQQLANASGLSVRTIQRIEAGAPASVESLKALAAVFEVDFSTLQTEETQMQTATLPLPAQEEVEAFSFVRRLRRFYLHLGKYVVVCAILGLVNLFLTPHKLWVIWPMLGWGIGVLFHGLRVFKGELLLGPAWEKHQVEKRLGRPL